ncbi:MAG TPA: hypothetical protein VFA37_02715 [Gaiellaceae bacterium]|nr:hypothetical protein [Gaiellaceae bacterium]
MPKGVGRRGSVFAVATLVSLVVVLAVGAGAGSATTNSGGLGPTVGCFNASKTIDSTTMSAHWCWDAALNLTDLSFGISQSLCHFDCEFYRAGYEVNTRTGGIGDHTASETFTSNWDNAYAVGGDMAWMYYDYWVHVVGGSHNLDFVETNWSASGA